MIPTRRNIQFHDFDQVAADIGDLQAKGYQRCGNWTLGQICDHLAIFMRGSVDGFSWTMPWIFRVTIGRFFLQRILRQKKMAAGVRVPKVFLPGESADDVASVESLLQLVRRYQDHTGPMAPSPFSGELSRQEWDQLHLIHAAHHLSFLRAGS
jgi:hypothetical protein